MRPSLLKPALRFLRSRQRAAFLWGPPGVGKSELVAQLADEDKLALIDFRMALRDPTDIKGFPIPDMKARTMVFLRDAELPTAGEGILFMDELNSALPATQAAGMQLTLTGRIGDYALPPGWSIIAAGNRETDRSVVNRMPAALANRFVHLDYEVSHEDWCTWALSLGGVSPTTVGFIRARPNLLHAPDYAVRAFATPRTIVMADEIVQAKLPGEIEYELLKGTIGEGPASELAAYLRVAGELPTIEQLLKHPDTTPVPTVANAALLYALATLVGAHLALKTMAPLMAYLERMPVEFQILALRDGLRATPALASTKQFIAWGLANAAVTL